MKKVLVMVAYSDDATAYYRLSVLKYINHSDISIDFKNISGNISWSTFLGYTHLILERPSSLTDFHIIKLAKSCGLKIIVDVDDDVLHLDPFNPMYSHYEGSKSLVIDCIVEADEIWVSTKGIKKSFALYNSKIQVIPNSHNDYLQPIEKKLPFNADNKLAIWRGGACFDEETEVLTKSGFKFFRDLIGDDLIATLSSSNKLEYNSIDTYYQYRYNGKMHYYKNGYVDLLVTPNHKIYSSSVRHGEYKLQYSQDVFKSDLYFKLDCEWEGENISHFEIPMTKDTGVLLKWDIDDWIKFFGFWLADGWTWTYKNREWGQFGFALFKGDDVTNEIITILDKYKFKYTKRFINDVFCSVTICDNNLFNYLKQFGKSYEKFIPDYILNLKTDKLKIFLEWFLKGDGSREFVNNRVNPRIRGYTSSPKLADGLMEISLKVGWASSLKNRGIRVKSKTAKWNIQSRRDAYDVSFLQNNVRNFLQIPIKKNQQKEVDYNGSVYCVDVKNHILYVRRNGKCCWSGNSHEADVYEQAESLIEIINYQKDWKFQFIGARFIHLEQRCGDNYQPVSMFPLMQYFEYLHKQNPNIVFHPLSKTKFNESKSDIAYLEATYAGAAFVGNMDLPEFKDKVCLGDLNEALNMPIETLQSWNETAWGNITTWRLLSNVNELRKERLLSL